MRVLGLGVNSAGAIRIVRRHVVRLGLDTSHFRGKRSWSDAQLRRAVIDAQSWDELLTALGLAPASGDGRTRVKAHAMRLGLDLTHLENPIATCRIRRTKAEPSVPARCGNFHCRVLVLTVRVQRCDPGGAAVYDLLVSMPDEIKRVQVKTTTYYSRDGWMVVVGRRPYSVGNKERLVPYDPELIDLFFIVDGDLSLYLIPSKVIAGRVGLLLRTYEKYIVGNAAGLMAPRSDAA